MYVTPFTIHPRRSASMHTSSNLEVISLLEDLKQHILLLEDGLMMTMTSDQQATFVAKRNLLVPPIPLEMKIHTERSLELIQPLRLPQSTVPPVLNHRTRKNSGN